MASEDKKQFLRGLEKAKRSWEKKRANYEIQRSITASPSLQFELDEGIEKCQQEIQRLSKEIQRLSETTEKVSDVIIGGQTTQPRKILILSANPKGTSQLRLDEEKREIKERLRLSKKGDQFEIETAEAVRYGDIRRAILNHESNIVHFSGHGAGEDGLLFEDETGQMKLVDAETLAELFKLFAEQVECVVLNACYSEVQAEAIAQHISHVIGMSQAIQDRAAIAFVKGFYDGLGFGKSYEFAYKLGCNAIREARIPGHLTPQLLGTNYSDTVQQFPETQVQRRSEAEDREQNVISDNFSDLQEQNLVDYRQLSQFLANGQWREADLETMRVMLEIADREERGWLQRKDIEDLPDTAIQNIDKLWLQYSQGHFGLSVQARIWLECRGETGKFKFTTYQDKFCDRTGWYINEDWLNQYDNFEFSLNAPPGHLPSLSFPDCKNQKIKWATWKETFEYLLPRLFSCLKIQ